MRKYTLFIFISVLFISQTAAGQINIRLPRVNVPKKEEAAEKAKQATGNPAASQTRGQNRQHVIDDGFTFFGSETIPKYDQRTMGNITDGWALHSNLRMFGTVPNRSGFNVVVSKGGKQLARIRCEGAAYRKAENPVPELRNVPEDDYVMTQERGCVDKTKLIRETGKMDVQVFFFDGDTDQEKLLRTYKIDVHEAKRVRGTADRSTVDASHFYIQRHAETPAAILLLRPSGMPNYFRRGGDRSFASEIEIYFNISKLQQVKSLPTGSLRCSVNGSPLRFPGPQPYSDETRPSHMRSEWGIYNDRLSPQYKTGPDYKDEVSFSVYRIRLPLLLKNDPANNRLGFLDQKGNWECSFRINGETIRTFRWQTGSDGLPVPHAEQASGNINLAYNAFFIEAEAPAGGSSFDHRLLPLPNDGFFYGIPWKSAEGKAAAAKVPTKGRPYHVSSTGK